MAAPVRVFFGLAFALTWTIGGVGLLLSAWFPASRPLSPSNPLYYLAAYAVSLAGVGLTARYDGWDGLRTLGRRLIPRRSSAGWLLVVLLAYAAITVAALLAAASYWRTPVMAPTAPAVFGALALALLKDPGPIGEEFGWRGFALPRLLEQHGPVNASVRLGLLHAAWHLPLFFIPGMPQTEVSLLLFTLGVVSISIFATMLYLRSDGNLLLAILVHLLANVCGGLAAEAHALSFFLASEGVLAAVVVATGGLSQPANSGCTRRRPRQRRGR
jgi:membrane protease YdiL (CAAX protease family)